MPLFGPPNVAKLKERRDVAGLIKALGLKPRTDRDFKIRIEAADALGELKDTHAVPALVSVLGARVELPLREHAARALGSIGDPAAIAPLIEALDDPSWLPLHAAESLLAFRADQRVFDAFVRCAQRTHDPNVRAKVAEDLAIVGGRRAVPVLRDLLLDQGGPPIDPKVEAAMVKTLEQIGGSDAIDALLAALQGANSRRPGDLTRALVACAEQKADSTTVQTIEALQTALEHVRADLASLRPRIEREFSLDEWFAASDMGAAFTAGFKRDEAQAESRLNSLQEAEGLLLARLGVPELTLVLEGSADAHQRMLAAEQLGEVGAASMADLLFETSSLDADLGVRSAAARALAAIGDARAAGRLVGALRESLATSERPAMQGLIQALLEGEYVSQLTKADRLLLSGALGATLPQLTYAVPDTECNAVAQLLGQLGNPGGVDALIAAVEGRSRCAEAATKVLGGLGDRKAVNPLIAALASDGLRVDAAEALGKLGDPRAVRPLGQVLVGARGSESLAVRKAAKAALQLIGGPEAEQVVGYHLNRRGVRKPEWLRT